MLQGRCRYCQRPISWLYPFIELLTALSLSLLWYTFSLYSFIAYFILFSALIVTIRTDIETMLIARITTLTLIPLGLGASVLGLLTITVWESIIGALVGYALLWTIGTLCYLYTHKESMGEGDFELLAGIGAFTGPCGVWITLLIGSIIGSCIGLLLMYYSTYTRDAKIPFGPFLAFGALCFVLYQSFLIVYVCP